MSDILFIIVILIVMGLVMFIVPQWRLRRATPQVIRIFRDQGAVGIKNARTPDELGIKLPGMMEGILTRRDYKRQALKALIQVGIIVHDVESGGLYLSEDKLAETELGKNTSQYR